MCDALGIVAFESDNVNIEGLMDYRSIPAISFLGRYRLIDFVISNMTNSGMSNIKVFVKKQPRSLIEQLGNGSHYNINSKRGKLQILYAETDLNRGIYNTDIRAYIENMEHIEEAQEEYVVVAPSYFVESIDFNDVLKEHKETGADITVVYKSVDDANSHYIGCSTINISREKRVEGTAINRGQFKNRNIAMDTYVLSRKLFIDLVNEAYRTSSLYTFKDILRDVIGPLTIHGYQFRGYVGCLNSLSEYFKESLKLINYDSAKQLFKPEWPIHTKTNDSPPAYYGNDVSVKNCLIANGCQIEGELEGCVLGRGVIIHKGCKIRNSIILPDVEIGEDADIDNAIIDKHSKIMNVKKIQGTLEKPAYIKRRDRI